MQDGIVQDVERVGEPAVGQRIIGYGNLHPAAVGDGVGRFQPDAFDGIDGALGQGAGRLGHEEAAALGVERAAAGHEGLDGGQGAAFVQPGQHVIAGVAAEGGHDQQVVAAQALGDAGLGQHVVGRRAQQVAVERLADLGDLPHSDDLAAFDADAGRGAEQGDVQRLEGVGAAQRQRAGQVDVVGGGVQPLRDDEVAGCEEAQRAIAEGVGGPVDAPAAVEVRQDVVVGGAHVGLGRAQRDHGVARGDGRLRRGRRRARQSPTEEAQRNQRQDDASRKRVPSFHRLLLMVMC